MDADLIVVGGGPAGLRSAELASGAGLRTLLADQMRSVGRKFLVAGRGGLNLTHSEPMAEFLKRYGEPRERWENLLAEFSPDDLRSWAKDLGVETFVGTSRRVFPLSKQAAPLLRRWLERLRSQNVELRMRHRFSGFRRIPEGWEVKFEHPGRTSVLQTRAVVFALGGASWPRTGSDGTWVPVFEQAGLSVRPLASANCGYEVAWPPEFLARAEGLPLKNVTVSAGGQSVAGELLITKYGLEGGALYQLGRELRRMDRPHLLIDLKPGFTREQLREKWGGSSWEEAARAWRLSPVAVELLRLQAPYVSAEDLLSRTKALPLALLRPRPIAESISTAGGVSWENLDDWLMLKNHPGIFCAGEMVDWEAPTGGYLLQGCFATGTRAARGAIQFLQSRESR